LRGGGARPPRHILGIAICAICILLSASCKREERAFRVAPPNSNAIYAVSVGELHAGGGPATNPAAFSQLFTNDYEHNAQALSEGKRLYNAMNCSGCHFQGGGGIGPPLMDQTWIYGGNPDQIFATVVEGRPNGMPSYRGKIVDYQLWQIVAYVRSLSGQASSQAAPGRSDQMQSKPPENSMPSTQPINSFKPKSTEMPG
jgi:cytochrome c oxidase cbb3-type subunit 3